MTQAQGSAPRSGRRHFAALAVVGVLALGGCGGEDSSKFTATEPEAGAVMTLEEPDKTFTLSALYISHPGSELRVLEVEALTSPNVEYLGTVNVWPRDLATNALSVGHGFPAPEIKTHHVMTEVVPAAETDVPALPGVASQPALTLAVGFRLVSGDVGAVNGVRAVYTVDGKKTEAIFRDAVIVCAQKRFCKPSNGESDSEFNNRVLTQFGLLPNKN